MKSYGWTQNELQILEEWDWVSKFIEAQDPEFVSTGDAIKYYYLKARLIIPNKLIIVYSNDSMDPVAIMSYREFTDYIENSGCLYKNVLYHPINFSSIDGFHQFLSEVREKILSLPG